MKIITSIVAVALIIGVFVGIYIFIKDQKIKEDLATVEEAVFVEGDASDEMVPFDSEIKLTRNNGVWTIEDTETFSVDIDSLSFEFTGYKPGGLHTGTFQNINSVIRLNTNGEPVSARLAFDIASVKTDSSAVDEHLQTDDFFSANMYPEIIAEIKRIDIENGSVNAITDISMKGVTRTISIPVQVQRNDGKISFNVDTRIKISDFNIAYGPVQDEVRVTLAGTLITK